MKYKIPLIALFMLPLLSMQSLPKERDIFSDYEQLLPRGGIAAIVNPQYVTAAEAKIKDNSYVLGVLVEGQARAFSLNLLNQHEVVNDKVGDVEFAVVW